MASMVEVVARAIALENGDKYDEVPRDKPHYIDQRCEFGGRMRDINEPFQCDYDDMARAALEALKEPTPEMEIVGARSLRDDMGDANFSARARRCHRAMITTALEDT